MLDDGSVAEHTVLWMGDSFFDEDDFFVDFSERFAGQNVATVGIGGATTHDITQMTGGLVHPYDLDALVLHIGTNNIYDLGESATTVVNNLKTFINEVHQLSPNTQIYWFSICYRTWNTEKNTVVDAVNDGMETYLNSISWGTFLDIAPQFSNGSVINESMFADGIHPKIGNYYRFTDLLKSAGLDCFGATFQRAQQADDYYFQLTGGSGNAVTTKSGNTYTLKLTNTDSSNKARAFLYNGGTSQFYSGDFTMEGTITRSSASGWRFAEMIMLEKSGNGWYSKDYRAGVLYANDSDITMWGYGTADATNTNYVWSGDSDNTINFKLVVANEKVLWTVNGVTKETKKAGSFFGFGAEGCNVTVTYTLTVGTQTDSESVDDFTSTQSDAFANTAAFGVSSGAIVSGKVDITSYASNAHLSFNLNYGDANNRFLIWDNDSDGAFGVGWASSGTYATPTEEPYSATGGTLTLEWKLVYHQAHVYFYVNGALKAVYQNLYYVGSSLTISTEGVACKFYDMTIVSAGVNPAGYVSQINSLATDLAKANGSSNGIVFV